MTFFDALSGSTPIAPKVEPAPKQRRASGLSPRHQAPPRPVAQLDPETADLDLLARTINTFAYWKRRNAGELTRPEHIGHQPPEL